ncbi:hypothetical protein, partial [Spirochaeta lutea]|uniref:hypothetical protein n=1 Tax=Spirochaeta lutea TaxID=1480694 RepID=UPI00069197C6
EDIQGGGKDSITKTIGTFMNLAMKLEQEKALDQKTWQKLPRLYVQLAPGWQELCTKGNADWP